jgi:putative transposase
MRFRLVHELAAQGFPVAVTCRMLNVSTSGFYEWAGRAPSARDVDDAYLLDTIIAVHRQARGTYGARRVHAELVLGRRRQVGRRRVERLMRAHHLAGVHRRRWRRHQRAQATWPDRVQRQFVADRPDKLWVTDITQHRTSQGWVYCAVVLDVFSRRVVGWSIADHLRTELVVDALDMARWRRKPTGTIVHSDRGTQGGFNWSSQHPQVSEVGSDGDGGLAQEDQRCARGRAPTVACRSGVTPAYALAGAA